MQKIILKVCLAFYSVIVFSQEMYVYRVKDMVSDKLIDQAELLEGEGEDVTIKVLQAERGTIFLKEKIIRTMGGRKLVTVNPTDGSISFIEYQIPPEDIRPGQSTDVTVVFRGSTYSGYAGVHMSDGDRVLTVDTKTGTGKRYALRAFYKGEIIRPYRKEIHVVDGAQTLTREDHSLMRVHLVPFQAH